MSSQIIHCFLPKLWGGVATLRTTQRAGVASLLSSDSALSVQLRTINFSNLQKMIFSPIFGRKSFISVDQLQNVWFNYSSAQSEVDSRIICFDQNPINKAFVLAKHFGFEAFAGWPHLHRRLFTISQSSGYLHIFSFDRQSVF